MRAREIGIFLAASLALSASVAQAQQRDPTNYRRATPTAVYVAAVTCFSRADPTGCIGEFGGPSLLATILEDTIRRECLENPNIHACIDVYFPVYRAFETGSENMMRALTFVVLHLNIELLCNGRSAQDRPAGCVFFRRQ